MIYCKKVHSTCYVVKAGLVAEDTWRNPGKNDHNFGCSDVNVDGCDIYLVAGPTDLEML